MHPVVCARIMTIPIVLCPVVCVRSHHGLFRARAFESPSAFHIVHAYGKNPLDSVVVYSSKSKNQSLEFVDDIDVTPYIPVTSFPNSRSFEFYISQFVRLFHWFMTLFCFVFLHE